MRVLLVDDHPLFREGLHNLLVGRGIEVVGMARDGFEGLALARELRPDVVLMDIKMPQCDGLQATRLIKTELPDTKVVMLSVSAEDDDLFEAIKSGASGYLPKSLEATEFFDMLTGLARGEAPLPKALAARIVEEFSRQASRSDKSIDREGNGEGLSPRQTEILTLVAGGMTYKEIGTKVCLTERTVKYHMGQIVERLHVNGRAEAVSRAQRIGLIRGRQGLP